MCMYSRCDCYWKNNQYYNVCFTSRFHWLKFIISARKIVTAWKLSKYRVIRGPYFPVFGLNTEIYGVNLRIQSECRKIPTRNNSTRLRSKTQKLLQKQKLFRTNSFVLAHSSAKRFYIEQLTVKSSIQW